MGAVMSVLFELSWTIAAAWMVVFMWAVVQFVWWQRVRVVPAPQPPPRRPVPVRRPVSKKAVVTTVPVGGTPEFLAELGLTNVGSNVNAGDHAAASSESVYR
jgi:hypothetical protein